MAKPVHSKAHIYLTDLGYSHRSGTNSLGHRVSQYSKKGKPKITVFKEGDWIYDDTHGENLSTLKQVLKADI